MNVNNFYCLKNFISSILIMQRQPFSAKDQMQDSGTPLIRYVTQLNFEDYIKNDIHYFPFFTSTSSAATKD